MNSGYKHTQIGTLVIILIGAVMIYLTILAIVTDESIAIGILIPFFLFIIALFGTLTVELTEAELKLKFGIGFIRKSFSREAISEVKIVKNKWYYGWGIRFTTHGIIYCVSGLDAVEIKLYNGKQYRIGTDEPDALNEAICKWTKL